VHRPGRVSLEKDRQGVGAERGGKQSDEGKTLPVSFITQDFADGI
jgi:hypothetical protein